MILICQSGCSETHTGCMWTQMHKPGHTKHVGFVIPEALQHKGSFRIRTNRNTNARRHNSLTPAVCVYATPGGALSPCCWPSGSTPALPVFKRGSSHGAQTSECRQGWAGPPGLSGCGCHAADAFCYRLGGKRRRK